MYYKCIKSSAVLTAIIIAYLCIYSEAASQIGNIDACFKDIECTDNTIAWNKTEWEDEVKSICRIVTKYQNGSFLDSSVHTGVLINNPKLDNTRINPTLLGDNTLYILASYHVFKKNGHDPNTLVSNSAFYFNYYNSTCGDNNTRTTPVVLNESGGNATLEAYLEGLPPSLGSDYVLIKLNIKYDPCNNTQIDNLNDLFFAGFDKNPEVFYTHEHKLADYGPNHPPGNAFNEPGPTYHVTGLSHPGGNGYDYQAPFDFIGKGAPLKVHTYQGQILDFKNYTDPFVFPDHWKLSMPDGPPPTPLEYGVVTGGSSGSPLFHKISTNNITYKYVTGLLSNSTRAQTCGIGEKYDLYYGKFSRSWEGNADPNSSIKKAMGSEAITWSLNYDRLEGKKFDGGPIFNNDNRKHNSDDYIMTAPQVNNSYQYDCCWEITIDFPDDALCFGHITVEEGISGIEIEQTEVIGTDPVKFRYCPETEPATFTVRIYSIHGILLAEQTFTTGYCDGVSEFDCTCLNSVTVTSNENPEEDCCFTLNGITNDPKCVFYGFQILDGTEIIYQNHGNSTPIANETEFCIDRSLLGSNTFKLQFLDEYDGSGMAAEVLCENEIALPMCDLVDCCEGFKILEIAEFPLPGCLNGGCPIKFIIEFSEDPNCDIQDVNFMFNGNIVSNNGNTFYNPVLPYTFCVISPYTITAVTTNLPDWLQPCSDQILVNCTIGRKAESNENEVFGEIIEYAYVFPNPSSDDVTIHFKLKMGGVVNLEILDLTGKVVTSDNLGLVDKGEFTKTIDISLLPTGNYFLRFSFDDLTVPFPIQVIR